MFLWTIFELRVVLLSWLLHKWFSDTNFEIGKTLLMLADVSTD